MNYFEHDGRPRACRALLILAQSGAVDGGVIVRLEFAGRGALVGNELSMV
jgi:hypothetical protein